MFRNGSHFVVQCLTPVLYIMTTST